MDKYEYRVKTEQMLEYMENKLYAKAMEIADTIDWRRVKNTTMLNTVSEIYECNGEYQKGRDILFIAYDRTPGSRKIVYRLGTLAVKVGDLQEAMDCYEEFIALAPKDPNQYILKYKILRAKNAPIEQQIEALVDFKKVEYVEKWAYELAKLYQEAGLITECLEECDDLILWFSEGKYVFQAMQLKMKHKPLTPLQQEKYNKCLMEQTKLKFKKPEKVEEVQEEEAEEQPEEVQEEQIKEQPEEVQEEQAEEQPEEVQEEVQEEEAEEQPEEVQEEQAEEQPEEVQEEQAEEQSEEVQEEESQEQILEVSEEQMEEKLKTAHKVTLKDILKWRHPETAVKEEEPEVEEVQDEEVQPEVEEVQEEEVQPEAEEVQEEEVQPEAEEVQEEEVQPEAEEVQEEEVQPEAEEIQEEEVQPEVEEEQISPQEKMEGILQSWEETQRAVEKEIALKKQQAEAEKAEREAKRREMEKQNMFNTVPIIPEDIQQLLDDLENGILDKDDTVEEEHPVENTVEPEVVEETVMEEEAVFVEEPETAEIEEQKEEPVFTETYEENYEETQFVEETDVTEEPETMEQPEQIEAEPVREFDDDIITQEFEIPLEEELVKEEEPVEEEPKTAFEQLKEMEIGNDEPLGGVSFDTGFIVQGRYDLEAQSEIGLKAGLTEEQKKLFSYFVPVRGMSEQIVEVLQNDKECKARYGTSRTGNILVVGRPGTGKTVLAVNIVKAIQKNRKLKQGKVAIVTGDALNKKQVSSIVDKLKGGALIIEKAGKMNSQTIYELNDLMEEQTGELLVVLEEQRKPLERLLEINPNFKRKFTSKLELPIFINDELVTFGQTYAKENGYKIDEMGILALYSRIDVLQKEDHAVTVTEVKEILDSAIEHAQKMNFKRFMKRLFGKRTDNSDRVILTEQDFK